MKSAKFRYEAGHQGLKWCFHIREGTHLGPQKRLKIASIYVKETLPNRRFPPCLQKLLVHYYCISFSNATCKNSAARVWWWFIHIHTRRGDPATNWTGDCCRAVKPVLQIRGPGPCRPGHYSHHKYWNIWHFTRKYERNFLRTAAFEHMRNKSSEGGNTLIYSARRPVETAGVSDNHSYTGDEWVAYRPGAGVLVEGSRRDSRTHGLSSVRV